MDFKKFLQKFENSPHVRRLAMEVVLASEGLTLVASPEGPPPWCFLHKLKRCKGGSSQRPRWKDSTGKYFFEWDARHKHIEAYDRMGKHVGVCDVNGTLNPNEQVKGRKINVR